MTDEICRGYHATARKNISSILNNKFIISKPGKHHWLGKGVYFFENIYYAIEWQLLGVIKKRNVEYDELMEESGIIVSEINTSNYSMLDLSNPYGLSIFEELLIKIKDYYGEAKYEEYKQKGDKFLIDLLEELEEQKNIKLLSNFDIISAEYPKWMAREKNVPGNFIKCIQKQICVKNINAIVKSDEYTDNEIIKSNYELILKNRGNVK